MSHAATGIQSQHKERTNTYDIESQGNKNNKMNTKGAFLVLKGQ